MNAERAKPKANGASPDSRVATFKDWFAERYKAEFGKSYVFRHAKEGRLVKGVLGALDQDDAVSDALDELKAAAEAMFADDWGRDKAAIGLLSSQINKWRQAAARPTGGQFSTSPADPNDPRLLEIETQQLAEARQ